MQLITEQAIETAVEYLNESENIYQKVVEALKIQQPLILSYLFIEDFRLFTQKERDFMLFLVLVIWEAIKSMGEEVTEVTEKQLSDAEELNWEKIQNSSAKNFRDKLDVFFDQYPQEDLLAFVEDAITDEEEEFVTKEGRESIFVSMKSIIDCLTS